MRYVLVLDVDITANENEGLEPEEVEEEMDRLQGDVEDGLLSVDMEQAVQGVLYEYFLYPIEVRTCDVRELEPAWRVQTYERGWPRKHYVRAADRDAAIRKVSDLLGYGEDWYISKVYKLHEWLSGPVRRYL